MGETIEAGDKVTFNYKGSLEDGTTFHTFDEEPLAVEIGSGLRRRQARTRTDYRF